MDQRPFFLGWKLLLLSFVLLLSGCTGSPFQDAAAIVDVQAESIERKLPPPGSLERIDLDISKLTKKKEIKQEDANVQRELAAESADTHDHHLEKAAEAEEAIVRIERELAKLEKKKQELLSESMGCFPPDTFVLMENGSTKPFADIAVGDLVMTYDIGHEVLVGKPVIDLYSLEANHIYTINAALKTTGGERLLSQDGWKTVRNLKVGDFVHVNGHMVGIGSIRMDRVEQLVINMQVAETHNFYVRTPDGSAYLVHNSSGGGGGSGGK